MIVKKRYGEMNIEDVSSLRLIRFEYILKDILNILQKDEMILFEYGASNSIKEGYWDQMFHLIKKFAYNSPSNFIIIIK